MVEVFLYRGILRKPFSLGAAKVELKDLLTKCEIDQELTVSFPTFICDGNSLSIF
jgi:hypothetical protein